MKAPLTLLAALSVVTTAASAQVILNDTFDDLNRSNQDLPTSSAWFLYSQGTTTLSAATGALVFTQNSSPVVANILTYFTASGSPRTLADGETLTASFTLAVSNVSDSDLSLRLGLFNSGGSRVSASSTSSFTSTDFNSYTGYWTSFSTGATATNYSLNERVGTNNAIFGSGVTVQLNSNPNNVGINATAATPFDASFSLARTGTSYSITSIINGQTATITDNSISASAFDTLALQFGSGAVTGSGTVTLDNILVSVVPEPSTALLAGLGVLAIALRRRRK